MSDSITQAEIDALLKGASGGGGNNSSEELSSQEKDALGEIGNISMGTSATTLFTLLGQKVTITTPDVRIIEWQSLSSEYSSSLIAVKVGYSSGLKGANFLFLKEEDVKVITDLMMGGTGTNTSGEITDLHLSAIGEAMNQMMGSSCTSLSSMLGRKIDISPPKAFKYNFEESNQLFEEGEIGSSVVQISFSLKIGELIDSNIMQILPIPFAKSLVSILLEESSASSGAEANVKQEVAAQPETGTQPNAALQPEAGQAASGQAFQGASPTQNDFNAQERQPFTQNGGNRVNVQPAAFQAFDDGHASFEKKNIGLIMDVGLEVTVELGRTNKMIRDILEFGPGSIIELDKLAGEPVDIMVNGKAIAKGEVVVIDESFGVRITDIIHPSKRI